LGDNQFTLSHKTIWEIGLSDFYRNARFRMRQKPKS